MPISRSFRLTGYWTCRRGRVSRPPRSPTPTRCRSRTWSVATSSPTPRAPSWSATSPTSPPGGLALPGHRDRLLRPRSGRLRHGRPHAHQPGRRRHRDGRPQPSPPMAHLAFRPCSQYTSAEFAATLAGHDGSVGQIGILDNAFAESFLQSRRIHSALGHKTAHQIRTEYLNCQMAAQLDCNSAVRKGEAAHAGRHHGGPKKGVNGAKNTGSSNSASTRANSTGSRRRSSGRSLLTTSADHLRYET